MALSPSTEPQLVTLPDVTVAVVHTKGDPNAAGAEVMKALYGAAFALKFDLKKRGVDMRIEAPRARWNVAPDPEDPSTLQGDWALPVPDGTSEADLVQRSQTHHVSIERWTYGTCAWVVHLGGYEEEQPTIDRLCSFIEGAGCAVSGLHEEWYVSPPSAKVPKTVILYPVCEAGAPPVS